MIIPKTFHGSSARHDKTNIYLVVRDIPCNMVLFVLIWFGFFQVLFLFGCSEFVILVGMPRSEFRSVILMALCG